MYWKSSFALALLSAVLAACASPTATPPAATATVQAALQPSATSAPPTALPAPANTHTPVPSIPAIVVEDALDDCVDMFTGQPATCQGPWGDMTRIALEAKAPESLSATFTLVGDLGQFPPDKTLSIGFEFMGTKRTAVIELTPPKCEFTVKTVGTCSFVGNTITATLNIGDLPDCPDCDKISGIRFGMVYPLDPQASALIVDNVPDTGYIPLTFR